MRTQEVEQAMSYLREGIEGEGRIGRGEADRFGWYALEKVRAEMKARTPLATSEATNQQSMEGLRRSTG